MGLKKGSKGKRLKGLEIRKDHHVKHATPVTKQLISDEEYPKSDEVVTKQTRVSDGSDDSDDINSFVKKESTFDDDTEFFQ